MLEEIKRRIIESDISPQDLRIVLEIVSEVMDKWAIAMYSEHAICAKDTGNNSE